VRRLHLKLYLAIVGTMVAFLMAGAIVWHHFAPPHMAMAGIESATQLALCDSEEPRRRDIASDE